MPSPPRAPHGRAFWGALLAAYTLGYGAAVEESGIAVWPELIGLNLLYLAAFLFLAGARSRAAWQCLQCPRPSRPPDCL